MNTTALLVECRRSGFIGDADAEYTDAILLAEATDALLNVFAQPLTTARQGYWLHKTTITCAIGVNSYRIPSRAVVAGIEKIEISTDTTGTQFVRMNRLTVRESLYSENTVNGIPRDYFIESDRIILLTPPAAAYVLRIEYYLRPPVLYSSQTTGSPAVPKGKVTAVDTTLRTIDVNTVPNDNTTAAAITSGSCTIDVIHPDGSHELSLVDATQTLSGTTFTVAGTLDMSAIAVGDVVRAADQSDWPMLPMELHRSLADYVGAAVLAQKGDFEKAGIMASKADSAIKRVIKMASPRVKDSPFVFKARFSYLRRRVGRNPVMWGR